MSQEFTAYLLSQQEVRNSISMLTNQENIIKQAKAQRDTVRVKQAENEAVRLRKNLLNQADPTAVFMYLLTTGVASADEFRTIWQNKAQSVDLPKDGRREQTRAALDHWYAPPAFDLASFPVGSFAIQFEFSLTSAYISRDDNDYYIIDNPVVRDKVFKLPMVRPTSWKGALRAAMRQLNGGNETAEMQHIFGEANEEEEGGHAGRLYFYPSFFSKSSLEIINPHDRKKKVGRNPILIEAVPQEAVSTFSLLYLPFDLISEDQHIIQSQSAKDLAAIAQGLQAMFTGYGFGAKTSSGYGTADLSKPKPGVLILQIQGGPQGWAKQPFNSFDHLIRSTQAFERAILKRQEGGNG